VQNVAPAGLLYDTAGDVLNDNVNQYLYEGVPVDRSWSTGWDGEGRICAVASTPMPNVTAMTGYLYDADGARVGGWPRSR
jgi:hypothetical protein